MRFVARPRRYVAIFSIAALVAIVMTFVVVRGHIQQADAGNPTSTTGYTATNNHPASLPAIGSTQVTSEGVAITLLGIEKHGSRWLFHVRIANKSGSVQQVLGGQVHRFVLPARASDGSTVDYVLSNPSAPELIAHPAMATLVAAGSSFDGWIAGNISKLGYTSAPRQFIYEYDPIASQKCRAGSPPSPSTCSPVNLYHMLIWQI